jgi:DNA-binding transcriptional LysR family regulator
MPSLDGLTLRQMRALMAVAGTGSLTAAARTLGLTTPAIHSQIKNLEIAARAPLLTRDPGHTGLVPTHEGTVILAAARRIEAILSHAAAQLGAMKQGLLGQVTLGVVSTGKYFAPRLIRILSEVCPDIEVALRVGNRESIIANLDRGAIDLAVMGRPPRMPEVVAVPLGPHPSSFVLPPGHPMATASYFEPEQLLSETLIAREAGSGTRILLERYLDRIAEGREVRLIEMDSNETIKQAVMAGLGIAMLSLHTVSEELGSGRLHLLTGQGLPIMRQWYLVHRVVPDLTAVAAKLSAQIVDLNGVYLPQLPMPER